MGIKDHCAGLKPTMNMDTAAKTLNVQQDLKAEELSELVFGDFERTHKSWSDFPTAPYTTTFGESLIKGVNDRVKLYSAIRVSESEFQVNFIGDNVVGVNNEGNSEQGDEYLHVPLPLFGRIRHVKLEMDGTLMCDCCHFQGCGLFCVHQVKVATAIHEVGGIEFKGFTHHDIAARYLSGYMHLAYRESTPKKIRDMYHHLACNAIRGPKLRFDIPTSMPIQDRQDIMPAIDRLKNYEKQDLDLGKFDAMFSHTYTPDSMSTQDEFSMFNEQMNCLNQMTSESCAEIFDASLNDADIPDDIMKSLHTRDVLKQFIEESCAAADYRGLKGRRAFEERLVDFRQWCNENPPDADTTTNFEQDDESVDMTPDGRQRKRKSTMVPMTLVKYTSGVERIRNTAHMG